MKAIVRALAVGGVVAAGVFGAAASPARAQVSVNIGGGFVGGGSDKFPTQAAACDPLRAAAER